MSSGPIKRGASSTLRALTAAASSPIGPRRAATDKSPTTPRHVSFNPGALLSNGSKTPIMNHIGPFGQRTVGVSTLTRYPPEGPHPNIGKGPLWTTSDERKAASLEAGPNGRMLEGPPKVDPGPVWSESYLPVGVPGIEPMSIEKRGGRRHPHRRTKRNRTRRHRHFSFKRHEH